MADFPTQFVKLNTAQTYQIGPGDSTQAFTPEGGYSVTIDGDWVLVYNSSNGYGQRIPASQVRNLVYRTADTSSSSSARPGATSSTTASPSSSSAPTKGTVTPSAQRLVSDDRGIPLGVNPSENTSKDPRELERPPGETTDEEAREGRARADAETKKREAEGELAKAVKKLDSATQGEQRAQEKAAAKEHEKQAEAPDTQAARAHVQAVVDQAKAQAGQHKDVETTYERDGKTTTTKAKK